jgi:hypothetical protein
MARDGVPLIVISASSATRTSGITAIYLRGIDSTEIIDTVHAPPSADGPGRRNVVSLTAQRCRSSSNAAAGGAAAHHVRIPSFDASLTPYAKPSASCSRSG